MPNGSKGHKAAILILELRISVESLTAARRNYLGVRCVPFSASHGMLLSVSYMEITGAQIQLARVGFVPRVCENSKYRRFKGYLDLYLMADRGLQRILCG